MFIREKHVQSNLYGFVHQLTRPTIQRDGRLNSEHLFNTLKDLIIENRCVSNKGSEIIILLFRELQNLPLNKKAFVYNFPHKNADNNAVCATPQCCPLGCCTQLAS